MLRNAEQKEGNWGMFRGGRIEREKKGRGHNERESKVGEME